MMTCLKNYSTLSGMSTVVAAMLMLGGCAGERIKPAEMGAPVKLSCINLSDELVATEAKGLFKIVWVTRLARGPYISERESAEGTFYRASPGGVFLGQPALMSKPSGPGTHMTFDGGIFVPRDSATAPQVYAYVANVATPAVPYPASANCENTNVVLDPVTRLVSVSGFAATMAKGTLDGVASGPAAYNRQAIAGGAAAGAVTGAIIATMMNYDVGKITRLPATIDAQFNGKLAVAARTAVPIAAAPKQP